MRRPSEERPFARRPDDERDPLRWRQSGGGSAVQQSLASGVRALPEPVELDDLRLAQIRHRILQQEAGSVRRPIVLGWAWRRTVAFALAFLLLGGITTAMAGRLYIRRLERATAPPLDSRGTAVDERERKKPRRWRMAVRQPAELEVSLGPDGAAIAVVEGRAEISGAEWASPVTLTPGTPWIPGVAGVPPSNATAPSAAHSNPAKADATADIPTKVADADLPDLPTKVAPRDVVTSGPTPGRRARLALLAPRELTPAPAPAAAPSAAPPAVPTPPPAAPTTNPSVEPAPFLAPPVVGADRARPAQALPPRHEPRAQAAPPDSPAEAFLVAGALRSLRSDHAPRDALAKLDEHRRRFPGGALHREAALARVEALLGLGRNDEARTVLDSLTPGASGTDRKARLARAELRADRGDCAGAVVDLNGLLAGTANDEVAARALYRRARCALRTRNVDGARVDLRDYLTRFPEGARKSEVEGLLRRLGD